MRFGVVVELHGGRAGGIDDLRVVGHRHLRAGLERALQRPGVVPLCLTVFQPRDAALIGPDMGPALKSL